MHPAKRYSLRDWLIRGDGRLIVAAKYQVFVSSTYEDLTVERDTVIKAILEMGHIPVGMEMFSAADDEQWKIITRHIDESDYYCVLVAHRYGSTTGGISFTRKEYEYAVAQGLPVLGFVVDDSAGWPREKMDTDPGLVAGLADFKELVKSRPVSFWRNADDLYGRVSIALSKAFTANPREGWIRASSASGPEMARELTRLSAENATMRQEIDRLQRKLSSDKTAEFDDLSRRLTLLTKQLNYKYSQSDVGWSKSDELSYLQYFRILAPSLLTEVELDSAAGDLAMEIREDHSRSWWTVAVNQVRALFAELAALELIQPSARKHGVADKGEYWSLTVLGREFHTYLHRRLLDNRLHSISVNAGNEPEEPTGGAEGPSEVADSVSGGHA